jgi:hypothetical protein
MKSAYNQSSSYQFNVMRKYLFIICTGISVFNLCAQAQKPVRPYEKIQLDGLNYLWYETLYDSSLIDDKLDGYSHFRTVFNLQPLIYNEKIYTAGQINGYNGIIGGFIECRDLSSGKILWKDRYGLKNNGHIEIPRIMFIEDGKLVSYGQIKRTADFGSTQFPHLQEMILSHRIYDLEKGMLYAFNHGDFQDSTLLNTHDDKFAAYQVYFYKEGKNVRYLQPKSNSQIGDVVIYSYLLDQQGKIITEDSIRTSQIIYNIAQISEDTLLIVELDSTNLVFRFVSPELETYFIKKTNYPFDHFPALVQLKEISTSYRKILFYNQRNEFYPDDYYEIYVFNFDGTIDHKYDLKNKYNEDFFPIRWDEKGGLLLVRNFQRPNSKRSKSMLDVRSYKNETEVINLQRYTSADSLRYITPLHITPLVNGKLLVFVKEGSYYVDTFKFVTLDNDAFALSYMLLDEKDLGITSGTNGYSTNSNDGLEFFPNPVTDALTIRFATPYKGLISLSDISGRAVMVRDVTDLSEEVNIDMSYLASGIYIVRLPQHISGRSYKVVKM